MFFLGLIWEQESGLSLATEITDSCFLVMTNKYLAGFFMVSA